MYTSAHRVGDLRFTGQDDYNPSWNQYSLHPDHSARSRPGKGKWSWPVHTTHGPDWYQFYDNSWGLGDNRGNSFQSYPYMYANTNDSLNPQLDWIEPHLWWYENKQFQAPLERCCSRHLEYDDANEFFGPVVYGHQGKTGHNRSADSLILPSLADGSPLSSVESLSLSTPFQESLTADWSEEQPRAMPDTCGRRGGQCNAPPAPIGSLPGTQAALRRCIRDLKRERLHLRRERRYLSQLNSQFRCILCSFKIVANRHREGGCQCPTGNPKGTNAGYGGEPRSGAPGYHHGANSDRENRFLNESSNKGRVNRSSKFALERYNAAWNALKTAESDGTSALHNGPEIPWPTTDLQYSSFECSEFYNQRCSYMNYDLPPEIAHNSFQLQKWKAFCFFVEAFGFDPDYTFELMDETTSTASRNRQSRRMDLDKDQERLVFCIGLVGGNSSLSKRQLEALKAQMQREKLRWHPDRWRMSMGRAVDMLEDDKLESAKAVCGAVIDISKACDAHLGGIKGEVSG